MALALLLLVPSSTAHSYDFLQEDQLICPYTKRPALERIVDASGDAALEAQVSAAIDGGACRLGRGFQLGITDRQDVLSPKKNRYVCFRTIDPVSLEKAGHYCAAVSSIKNIEAERKTRQGRYTLAMEGPIAARAICDEGGTVVVVRSGKGWERLSLVFPRQLDPPTRLVDKDRNQVIKEGCQGVDYESRERAAGHHGR